MTADFLPANCEEQAVSAVSLKFDDFMRLVAVLLDEEASTDPDLHTSESQLESPSSDGYLVAGNPYI